ncbi:MAG: selenocysteine-specific translation elongation factor [Planctomycetia bacterium]|nr:MAG: selenocysteine-specific translation elongation factor [Planctomycetia bacterium]
MSGRQLVIGTAGHIDHGKSALVRALTGVDPDRLPEEQARGMTIDLGFAHLAAEGVDLYFVDVPGHERFIRNMVAGATGIDAAVMVVAADDGVMPQTREHAELLGLLGLRRCVLVISKCDLADAGWRAEVEAEAREVLRGAGIEPVAAVHTSVQSGVGLDALRGTLIHLAGEAVERAAEPVGSPSWFRLPIDRAFLVPGRGVVVTGTAWHGRVAQGDELELWPGARRVRVRDMQSHNLPRESAADRLRLALNLVGVALGQVQRGCELATAGAMAETACVDVRLAALRMPGRTARGTLRVRLHLATSELSARLRLREQGEGGPRFAQLRPLEPIVCSWGQRFVLRDDGGARTLGGGVVLNPFAAPWTAKRPADAERLSALSGPDPAVRLEAICAAAGWNVIPDARLPTAAGLGGADQVQGLAERLLVDGKLVRIGADGGGSVYVHADLVGRSADAVVARVERAVTANPRFAGVPRGEWTGWMPGECPQRLRAGLAAWLLERGRVELVNGFVLPAGRGDSLSEADRALLDALMTELDAGGLQPPSPQALRARNARTQKRCDELLRLALARGKLVRLGEDMLVSVGRWQEAAQRVSEAIRARGPLTVSDIRTLLGSSRKFIVPLCESFDAAGVTHRSGDVRGAGPRAADQASSNNSMKESISKRSNSPS